MMAKRIWTKGEEEILIQCIQNNPHNIKEACDVASSKLTERTPKACQQHWYYSILKKDTKITFLSIGHNSFYKNRKNSGNTTIKPTRSNLWTKIKKFIKLI